ncbi:MAG: hypothetical protein ACXWC4_11135 [Telluria sp.]
MNKFVRWAGQYALAMVTMFALLVAVDMAKGTTFADAWPSALAWAVISSAIFIGARYYKAAQMADCAVCDQLQGSRNKP